jgi:structural maintenance of chromosome 4
VFKSAINDLEKSKIPKLERDLKKATDELEDLSGKEKKISESLNKHRQKFADAQSSFSRNQGRNKVLQFLNKLKNEGRLNGFYGRLVIKSNFNKFLTSLSLKYLLYHI